MTERLLPLLLKSSRLQARIAGALQQRDPDRVLILRLQTLRLMVQKRINAISRAMAEHRDRFGPASIRPLPARAPRTDAYLRTVRTFH